MAQQIGRGVRVEVALTFATADVVTAITKANPGVASSAAHGNANGTIGYLDSVLGMTELEGQAVSVSGTATGTFELEGIDTTNFTTFGASANFLAAATWATLTEATSYEIPDAEPDQIDGTVLLDNQRKSDAGMLALQNVKFGAFSNPSGSALAFVSSCARAGTPVVFRITLKNGERRVFRGTPGLPGESLSVSQRATSGFSVSVKGQILMLGA